MRQGHPAELWMAGAVVLLAAGQASLPPGGVGTPPALAAATPPAPAGPPGPTGAGSWRLRPNSPFVATLRFQLVQATEWASTHEGMPAASRTGAVRLHLGLERAAATGAPGGPSPPPSSWKAFGAVVLGLASHQSRWMTPEGLWQESYRSQGRMEQVRLGVAKVIRDPATATAQETSAAAVWHGGEAALPGRPGWAVTLTFSKIWDPVVVAASTGVATTGDPVEPTEVRLSGEGRHVLNDALSTGAAVVASLQPASMYLAATLRLSLFITLGPDLQVEAAVSRRLDRPGEFSLEAGVVLGQQP